MITIAKPWAKKFYNSKVWKECRASFVAERISIDGGLCEYCGDSTYKLGYIVDHIEELTPENINNPEVSLNHNNFQYLCLECHNTKTFGKEKEEPRYIFGERGEVILIPPEDGE